MLGWEVFVYRKDQAGTKTLMACWSNGGEVVDWLERLAKAGLAKDCGGTGYPWIFMVRGGILKPVFSSGRYGKRLLGELSAGLLPPPGIGNYLTVYDSVVASCTAGEELLVYAWDKS